MGHPLQSLSFAERDNCRTTHMTPSASSRSALTSQANARETGRRPLVKGSPRPALYSARHAEGDSSLMVAKKGAVRATENVEPEDISVRSSLAEYRLPRSVVNVAIYEGVDRG